jgi:hypothetical protein
VTRNNNPGPYGSRNWNEYNLNPLTRNHWRASLVNYKKAKEKLVMNYYYYWKPDVPFNNLKKRDLLHIVSEQKVKKKNFFFLIVQLKIAGNP